MTDKDKPNIQDSGISDESETAVQTPTPTGDKTLLRSAALADKAIDEPTRQFAAPALEQEQNALQNAPDTEPTKIFSDNQTDKETDEPEIEADEEKNAPDENALRPSSLRFALVCLLLIFTAGWTLFNFALLSWQPAERSWRYSLAKNAAGNHFVLEARSSSENVRIGDELMSINGVKFSPVSFWETEDQFKPGDRYTLGLRRDGQLLAVELVVPPASLLTILERYFLGLLVPALFLLFGGAIFLLKPNDKAVLLVIVTFCLLGINLPEIPRLFSIFGQVPPFLVFIYYAGKIMSLAALTVAFHLFLIFPERLRIVRRFPAFEYLLYLPCLIFILLPACRVLYLIPSDWMPLESDTAQIYRKLINIGGGIYTAAALTALLFNYLQASETNRRRIRLVAAGLAVSGIPNFINTAILFPLDLNRGGWMFFLARLSPGILPFVFAYAIVRHKVIPVSFVIRRGLQYLLAKNALRLLLILPILGIVWNIAANPNRTVYEILLQNSLSFYLFIAFAVALVSVNRYGLREWIDRKFFRELIQSRTCVARTYRRRERVGFDVETLASRQQPYPIRSASDERLSFL